LNLLQRVTVKVMRNF